MRDVKMFMATADSNWSELEISGSIEDRLGEIFKNVDVTAIWIEGSQKGKDPTTIDYSLLL